jgi:hypothetical protein
MVLLLLFGLYGLNEGEAGCLRRPVYFMDPSVYDENRCGGSNFEEWRQQCEIKINFNLHPWTAAFQV